MSHDRKSTQHFINGQPVREPLYLESPFPKRTQVEDPVDVAFSRWVRSEECMTIMSWLVGEYYNPTSAIISEKKKGQLEVVEAIFRKIALQDSSVLASIIANHYKGKV